MKASILLLLLCVFVAGVFVGIWLDWSAQVTAGGQTFTYELEKGSGEARLQVNIGDTIKLSQGQPVPGWNPTKFNMTFDMGNPCQQPQTSPDTCKIATAAAVGYTFSCSDELGDKCPDPAIQPQSTTGPLLRHHHGFGSAVSEDFAHLFGLHQK